MKYLFLLLFTILAYPQGVKISALAEAANITQDDLFVIVDSPGGTPVTKKITFTKVLDSIKASTLGYIILQDPFTREMDNETDRIYIPKFGNPYFAWQTDFNSGMDKIDSAVKYFDPVYFEVNGDTVTASDEWNLIDTNNYPVLDSVYNHAGTASTTASIYRAIERVNALKLNLSGGTLTGTLTGTTINAVTALQLNGTDINTTGTLTNVAYKGQNNSFTVAQTINNQATAATKIGLVNGASGASSPGLYLHNVSSTSIIPAVTGYGSTTGLFMLAYTKDSTSGQNAFHFSARKIGGTALTTGRPLVFANYTTELFSINYDGKTKIGTGTATEALDVTGNIKASGTVTGTNLTYKTQKRLLFQTALDSALISTTDTIPLGYTPISGTIDTVIIISYGATAPDYTLNLYHSGSTSAFSTAQAINAKGLVKKTTFADATFIAGKLYVVFPAVTTRPTRTKLAIYVIGTYD